MAQDDATKVRALAEGGNNQARSHLFDVLYDELHRVASRELRRSSGTLLSPTTLLHETFLNIRRRGPAEMADKPRFIAYAVRAMRGLIIDCLRRHNSKKRGSEYEFTELSAHLPLLSEGGVEIEKLRDGLDSLAHIDVRLAVCVDLKFFCGFSFAEIAELWQVSERMVQRDWDKARVLLQRLISDPDFKRGCHGANVECSHTE